MNSDFLYSIGYFGLARDVMSSSNCKTKVGAVLAKKTLLMACSNKKISHPKYSNGDDFHNSLCAELRCLLHTSHTDLNNSVIYVYRETKDHRPANARPCERCLAALKERNVKKMIYTIDMFPFYSWERI